MQPGFIYIAPFDKYSSGRTSIYHKDTASLFVNENEVTLIDSKMLSGINYWSGCFPWIKATNYKKPSVALNNIKNDSLIPIDVVKNVFLPFLQWVVLQPEHNLWDYEDKIAFEACFNTFNAIILAEQF